MIVCKCGTEMVTQEEWMGPEGYDWLGYDFAFVTRCPNRHFYNFWKHTSPVSEPKWMPGSEGYTRFHKSN